MARGTYSGRDVVKILRDHGFTPIPGRGGSHRKLVYIDPNTGEKRVVTVPLHGELTTGTLHSIGEQAGMQDFQNFLDWLDSCL